MFTFSEKTRQIGVFPQKILYKQTLPKITILLSAIFRIVLNFGNRSRESSDFSCILSQATFSRAVRGPLTSYRSEPRFEPPLNSLFLCQNHSFCERFKSQILALFFLESQQSWLSENNVVDLLERIQSLTRQSSQSRPIL